MFKETLKIHFFIDISWRLKDNFVNNYSNARKFLNSYSYEAYRFNLGCQIVNKFPTLLKTASSSVFWKRKATRYNKNPQTGEIGRYHHRSWNNCNSNNLDPDDYTNNHHHNNYNDHDHGNNNNNNNHNYNHYNYDHDNNKYDNYNNNHNYNDQG